MINISLIGCKTSEMRVEWDQEKLDFLLSMLWHLMTWERRQISYNFAIKWNYLCNISRYVILMTVNGWYAPKVGLAPQLPISCSATRPGGCQGGPVGVIIGNICNNYHPLDIECYYPFMMLLTKNVSVSRQHW